MTMNVNNIASQVSLQEGELNQSGAKAEEFQQVLQDLQSQQPDQGDEIVRLAGQRANDVNASTDVLYAQKMSEAQDIEGVRRILDELHTGHNRMRGLMDELRSGKSYNTQELMAIQTEVYDLSINLQVSTKVLSEVVTNVKQLLTQQV